MSNIVKSFIIKHPMIAIIILIGLSIVLTTAACYLIIKTFEWWGFIPAVATTWVLAYAENILNTVIGDYFKECK